MSVLQDGKVFEEKEFRGIVGHKITIGQLTLYILTNIQKRYQENGPMDIASKTIKHLETFLIKDSDDYPPQQIKSKQNKAETHETQMKENKAKPSEETLLV